MPGPLGHEHSESGRRGSQTLKSLSPVRVQAGCRRQSACPSVCQSGWLDLNQRSPTSDAGGLDQALPHPDRAVRDEGTCSVARPVGRRQIVDRQRFKEVHPDAVIFETLSKVLLLFLSEVTSRRSGLLNPLGGGAHSRTPPFPNPPGDTRGGGCSRMGLTGRGRSPTSCRTRAFRAASLPFPNSLRSSSIGTEAMRRSSTPSVSRKATTVSASETSRLITTATRLRRAHFGPTPPAGCGSGPESLRDVRGGQRSGGERTTRNWRRHNVESFPTLPPIVTNKFDSTYESARMSRSM